jgi:RNA methyltransferase, TrmH family
MGMTQLSARLLSLAAGLRIRKHREREGAFLIEGERLLSEAIDSACEIRFVIVREDSSASFAGLLTACHDARIPVYTESERNFRRLADTRSPQGIAAVAGIPGAAEAVEVEALLPRLPLLALHQISDPGNLGTILRAMDWFGLPLLLLSSGSVDAWNPKVVRSAMGSMFRVRILPYTSLRELTDIAARSGRTIAAAVATDGDSIQVRSLPERLILLFGTEAHGLPAEALDVAAMRLTIAGKGRAESLNLAMSVSIMLYEYTRHHHG